MERRKGKTQRGDARVAFSSLRFLCALASLHEPLPTDVPLIPAVSCNSLQPPSRVHNDVLFTSHWPQYVRLWFSASIPKTGTVPPYWCSIHYGEHIQNITGHGGIRGGIHIRSTALSHALHLIVQEKIFRFICGSCMVIGIILQMLSPAEGTFR
jgi:hypothetical protein